MGQKAKNAGKKPSKTCNKKANAKSVCGGEFRVKTVTLIQRLELQLMDVGRNTTYADSNFSRKVIKTNGTPMVM